MTQKLKPIQIFKPGRHTAMNGVTLDFSVSDINDCAAVYDPATAPAPLVVGHPKIDAPAYGWVQSLNFADGVLAASPKELDPAFCELVRAGRFKTVSASFYLPNSPNNPKPGHLYLRHVGFLGAAAPAVKGLKPVEFSEHEEGVVAFTDIPLSSLFSLGRLMRNLREYLIGEKGQDTADRVLPGYAVEDVERAYSETIHQSETTPPAAFAAPLSNLETLVTPEEKTRLETENAQLKAQIAANAAAAKHADHVAFAENLVSEARLRPAEKELVIAVLDQLGAAPVEFGEGDSKKSLIQAYKEVLTQAPKVVEFSEVATKATIGKSAKQEENPLIADAISRQKGV